MRKSVLPLAGLALLVLGCRLGGTQDGKVKAPERKADEQAIDKLTKEMVRAFENHDAAAIAANWTAEGQFIRNDGDPIRRRDEVQKGYAEFFKSLKGSRWRLEEIQVDGLSFPSAEHGRIGSHPPAESSRRASRRAS